MQDCMDSNKIKENKYKILRMSLILGSDDDRTETLNNFEESAREVDAMNDEIYLKDLEEKFYDTLKLEEEEKKLAILVDYIGGRVEQRISLLSDFANITGYDLSGLAPIKYYDKLDDYKERLKYIREYLINIEQINNLTTEVEENEKQLKDAYLSKATSEEYNKRNEEIILNKFKNIIKSVPELKNITEEELDVKLSEVIADVKESKKSLDIFTKSFTTLSGSGISYEEEKEYKSYVDNAKELYYKNKEQEYLLRIYQYLLIKEFNYSQLLEKRKKINNLLYERLDLRKNLNFENNDVLSPLYDLLEKQYAEIERQRENIENIQFLNRNIEYKKEQLNELEQENQKVEILSLLREFCIIDTYAGLENSSTYQEEIPSEIESPIESKELGTPNSIDESISVEQEESTEETTAVDTDETTQDIFSVSDVPQENVPDIPTETDGFKENEIIKIEKATKIDLELVHSKANKVMKRVGEMLGIKTEETKIISVSNESSPISQKELPKVGEKQEEIQPINPLPSENPLFNNDIQNVDPELDNVDLELEKEEENSFWFPSDTPDALNELPDLNITGDNFFTNNPLPDLNFPDLKVDFGPNDLEEK